MCLYCAVVWCGVVWCGWLGVDYFLSQVRLLGWSKAKATAKAEAEAKAVVNVRLG